MLARMRTSLRQLLIYLEERVVIRIFFIAYYLPSSLRLTR
jgi:hypothetical protein